MDSSSRRLAENRVEAALKMLGEGKHTLLHVLQHLFAEGFQGGRDEEKRYQESEAAKERAGMVEVYVDPSYTHYGVGNFSSFLNSGDCRIYELSGHAGDNQRYILRVRGSGSEIRAKMIVAALNADLD